MSRWRSAAWVAEQLQARGYTTVTSTVCDHPARVIWEGGRPVAFAAPGYAETRLDLIERAYGSGAIADDERQALLEELLGRWADETED